MFLHTLEGSTLWKFLTTEITRSDTSDLSRKEPLTSSVAKQRLRRRLRDGEGLGFAGGRARTLTLKCFRSAFLAAKAIAQSRCFSALLDPFEETRSSEQDDTFLVLI